MLKKIVFLLPFLFASAVYAEDYEYAQFLEQTGDKYDVAVFVNKEGYKIGSIAASEKDSLATAYKDLFEKLGWKTKKSHPQLIDALNHLGSDGWKVINYFDGNKLNPEGHSFSLKEVLLMRED